jgi:phosphohistidine swiveling domain-containing protein
VWKFPESDRLQPTLSAPQIQELSEMARSLEGLFGGPQDIEFAVADNTVHLLQSRPITTLDAADDVDWENGLDTSHTWTLISLLALKGPLYRLQLDFGLTYMDNMRQCYEETASIMSRGHLIHRANGYVFTRAPDDDPAILAQRQQRQAAKCKAYIDQGTTNYLEEMVPKISQIHADLRKLRSTGTSIQARVNYLAKCIGAAGFIMGHLHWCMIDRANQLDWPAEFHNITGEPAEESDVFLQAIPNRTTRLVARLRRLARLVREDSVLASAFAEGSYEILESPQQRDRPNAKNFSTQFRALMKEYGFRTGWGFGSSVKFEHPTWNMAPTKPLELIASYAQQDIDHLESMEARALKQRQLSTRRIRRKLADSPDQLEKFEFTRKRAQADLARMEDHNYLMEQSTVGQMREAMHLVGESLVKTGLIDHPADVLHISLDELKHLADGNGPDNLRSLVVQREDERARLGKLTPPPSLGKLPQPTPANQPEASSANETGNMLRGRTASRGRATGRARVLDAGGTPPRFQKGDILVTTNVGPDWTPFFPLLSGIVLDNGEIFQHPALVAREYRIPAVFQTIVGTTRIRDGQTITVDGGAGVVELGVPGEE